MRTLEEALRKPDEELGDAEIVLGECCGGCGKQIERPVARFRWKIANCECEECYEATHPEQVVFITNSDAYENRGYAPTD